MLLSINSFLRQVLYLFRGSGSLLSFDGDTLPRRQEHQRRSSGFVSALSLTALGPRWQPAAAVAAVMAVVDTDEKGVSSDALSVEIDTQSPAVVFVCGGERGALFSA